VSLDVVRALRELKELQGQLRKQEADREAVEVRCGVWRMREEQMAKRIHVLRRQLLETKNRSE
jgi:chromosome segregation ATPase